jgi:hypothetical protein
MSSFFPLAVLRRVSNDRFVKKFSECCCYTVKAENISAFHSNAATLYYFIYKINLVSHDYNPNSNFLSSSKTWFHNMEVFFRRLNNFSNSSAQTATPSPAEILPPPANPTPPSFAPTSHPAPPTPPGYSDGSPPLLQPTELEKIIPPLVLSPTSAGFGGRTTGWCPLVQRRRGKKNLMCVLGKKNHRNKNQASTSMGFLWFPGLAKNEEEKEEGRKKEEF